MGERSLKPVTLREVAAAAGLSVSTTARALAGQRNVAPDMVRRAKSAAEKLGYQRNAVASALRSQRTGMIGFVVPQIVNPFFPTMIAALERELQTRGQTLLLCDSQDDPALEAQRVTALMEVQIDGLIISPCDVTLSVPVLRQASNKLPVVQLDRYVDGSVTDWVGLDDAAGVSGLMAHLTDVGARSFAFISALPKNSSARLRLDAYRKEAGARSPESVDRVLLGDFSSDWGRAAGRELLASGPLPDAVVCGNDVTALGVMREFQIAGVRVPDDVLVVGYDDIDLALLASPTLTTMQQPHSQMARRCVDLLEQQRSSPAGENGVEHISIAPVLVVRDSTARPRR